MAEIVKVLKPYYGPDDELPNFVVHQNRDKWREFYNTMAATVSEDRLVDVLRAANKFYSCGQRSPAARVKHRRVIESRLKRGLSAAGRRRAPASFVADSLLNIRATLESDSVPHDSMSRPLQND